MELSDILINPSNHSMYDPVYSRSDSDRVLKIHNTLIDYFDDKLGRSTDWGGEYANYLSNIGITFQSENGWWSIPAVNPLNITSFINYQRGANGDPQYKDDFENYKKAAIVHLRIWSSGFRNYSNTIASETISFLLKIIK